MPFGWWLSNQRLNKPEDLFSPIPRTDKLYQWSASTGGGMYDWGYDGVLGRVPIWSRWVTDPQESMSFIARSRTEAVGRIATGGSIIENQNVGAGTTFTFPFGDYRSDHSGEFTRSIQSLADFYKYIFDHVE